MAAFGAILAAGIACALVIELTRERTPPVSPVTSPLPALADEIERLEGGFRWLATRGGKPLFTLEGSSMVRVGGGTQMLRGVERLGLHLDDGRVVTVSADRGRVREGGREGERSVVHLSGDVQIQDPDGTTLETETLEYDSERGTLTCPGPTTVSGESMEALVGSLVYRPDTRLLEGLDYLELTAGGPEPWQIDTEGATYRMTTGEIFFERPFRARRGHTTIVAGSGTLSPASEEQAGAFRAEGGSFIAERLGDTGLELAAAEMRVLEGSSGAWQRVHAVGAASIVFERAAPDGQAELIRLSAGGWTLTPADDESGRATMSAGPGFRVQTSVAEGDLEVRGVRLDALRGPDGRLERLTGREDIEFRGPENTTAEGSEFAWAAEAPDQLIVRGEPARGSKERDVIEAPELVFERRARLMIARGGAVAELVSIGAEPGSLFRDDEPVRVSSSKVVIPQRSGDIVFEGPVQAWQGASTLRSRSLRFDPHARILKARGEVDLTVDRQGGDGSTTRSRLHGETLDYAVATRIADVGGAARFEQPGVRLDAASMRVHFGAGSNIERLVATGSVRLRTDEAAGRADRLIWEGGAAGTVWLEGEDDVAVLEFTENGQSGALRVGRLRYDLSSGQAFVDSGPGRGTLESGSQPVDAGDPDTGREGEGDRPG
jgi:lipopolysaccharide export system protein LptA